MTASDRYTDISSEDRNRLEAQLIDFDLYWTPEQLDDYIQRVSKPDDPTFTRLAVLELVKIDMQRSWMAGHGRTVEMYFERIAVLAREPRVDPELLFVEFSSRKASGDGVALSEYASRFPDAYPELERLVAQASDSQIRAAARAKSGASASPARETSRSQAERRTCPSDSESQDDAESPSLPRRFGRYEIVRRLGTGAMGTVYLAHDRQIDRPVAIKTPRFSSRSRELVTRFYTEARAAGRIRHRNICPIYDVGEIDGRHYMAMAYIRGRSLQDHLASRGPFPTRTAALIIYRLARALAEAHSHHVVHRDLKPANIMVDEKGEPIVMDFGLARRTDDDIRTTQSGVIVGTPAYMAPEQVVGDREAIGPWTDIYALGVVFYELLTGQIPFRGTVTSVIFAIAHEDPKRPSQVRPEIDRELEAICLKMMAKKPADRYATMGEVAAELKRYLKNAMSKSPSESESATQGPATTVPTAPGDVSQWLNRDALPIALPPAVPPSPPALPPGDTAVQSSKRRASPRGLPLIGLLLAGAAAALSVILYVRSQYGTVRIEIAEGLTDVDVRLDGKSVAITGRQAKMRARKDRHRVAIRIGGREVRPGDEIPVPAGRNRDRDVRLRLELDGTEMTGQEFEVASSGETLIRITYVEHSPPPDKTASEAAPRDTPDQPDTSAQTVSGNHETSKAEEAIDEVAPKDSTLDSAVSEKATPTDLAGRPEPPKSEDPVPKRPPPAASPEKSADESLAESQGENWDRHELRIGLRVAGKGELRIHAHKASWITHKGKMPTSIQLNDVTWQLRESKRIKGRPVCYIDNVGANQYLPPSSVLVRAHAVTIRGRGKVAIRRLGDHVYLRFEDLQPGAGDYLVVLSVPTQEVTRAVRQEFAPFVGRWHIRYTNGVVRRYVLREDGRVSFGSKESGRLVIDHGEVIFQLNDGELERLTLSNGKLSVQAFYPPNAPSPKLRGKGVRCPDYGNDYASAVRTVVGRWRVRYSNRAVRIYDIRADGTIVATFGSKTRRGKLELRDGNLIVALKDDNNIIETIFQADDKLYVARYQRINSYPHHAQPNGVGTRMTGKR